MDDLERRRRQCFAEFCTAVDAAVTGDYAPGWDLVARHPSVRGELAAFVRAVKAGKLKKVAHEKYATVRPRD